MGEGRVTRGAEAGMDAGWRDLSRIPVDCKSEIAVRLTGACRAAASGHFKYISAVLSFDLVYHSAPQGYVTYLSHQLSALRLTLLDSHLQYHVMISTTVDTQLPTATPKHGRY
jgi:hypothetical protein